MISTCWCCTRNRDRSAGDRQPDREPLAACAAEHRDAGRGRGARVGTIEPYAGDATLAQRRPAATRAGARVYLAWESESPDFDERASELFVARVELDAEDKLVQRPEQAFPPGVPRAGDQRNPHLASNDLFPEGAVIMLFEDRPLGANSDVLLDYRPSPFVWLE